MISKNGIKFTKVEPRCAFIQLYINGRIYIMNNLKGL